MNNPVSDFAQFKEQVRARASIMDIFSRYTDTSKARKDHGTLMVPSPFNQEKTPSCSVDLDKQLWHDFSSGQGGDIFKLVMLKENIGFREAVENVGAVYGMVRDPAKAKEKAAAARAALDSFHAASVAAASAPENAARVTALMEMAGIPAKWRESWKIGYIPGNKSLLAEHSDAATKLGLSPVSPGGIFATDALCIRLSDEFNRTLGLAAQVGDRVATTPTIGDFNPGEYLFRTKGQGEPFVFSSPFSAIAHCAKHPNTATIATLGLPLTLSAFERIHGAKVSAGPAVDAIVSRALEARQQAAKPAPAQQ